MVSVDQEFGGFSAWQFWLCCLIHLQSTVGRAVRVGGWIIGPGQESLSADSSRVSPGHLCMGWFGLPQHGSSGVTELFTYCLMAYQLFQQTSCKLCCLLWPALEVTKHYFSSIIQSLLHLGPIRLYWQSGWWNHQDNTKRLTLPRVGGCGSSWEEGAALWRWPLN